MPLRDEPTNPYMFGGDGKSKREKSGDHERRWADLGQASAVPGSGCWPGNRGDIDGDVLKIEHKYTGKKSIRIKIDDVQKIQREAMDARKVPGFGITFDSMPEGLEPDWVMVPLPVMIELLGEKL